MFTNGTIEPFAVKDCALLTIATGKRAGNLKEMTDHLLTIHPGSIYHYFWGGLLRPRFADPEYNNDFAEWVHNALQDDILAERLSIINPAVFADLESLRHGLLEIMEQRLDEIEMVAWAKVDMQFHFVRSQRIGPSEFLADQKSARILEHYAGQPAWRAGRMKSSEGSELHSQIGNQPFEVRMMQPPCPL
jgi:hypothetical protein